jgi:hypothetical protein
MKLRCFEIDWDTDGEAVDLPTEVVVEVEEEDEAADALSDRFGWCVNSLSIEVQED